MLSLLLLGIVLVQSTIRGSSLKKSLTAGLNAFAVRCGLTFNISVCSSLIKMGSRTFTLYFRDRPLTSLSITIVKSGGSIRKIIVSFERSGLLTVIWLFPIPKKEVYDIA